MHLQFLNNKLETEIINLNINNKLIQDKYSVSKNILIKSENIFALKSLIDDFSLSGKIDLIYIDPPFATNNIFTLTKERANTISNSTNGSIAYQDLLKGSAFIEFLRERLLLLKLLLSEKGSIYLHTDYKIGHYVKVMMDDVFGIDNFRNDISRIKCNPKNFSRKGYGNIKDMILFYSKSDDIIWNEPKNPYNEDDKIKLFPKTDDYGRRYTTVPLHAPGETQNGNTSQPFKGILPPQGRHWRSSIDVLEKLDEDGLIEWSDNGNPRKIIYFDEQEGKRVQDIWEFKDPQYPVYPTEKNFEMIDLIIKTSSNKDSYVLDCFCGSGTTLKAAHINNRYWIGIDQSDEAINKTIEKLENISDNLFQNKVEYNYYKVLK